MKVLMMVIYLEYMLHPHLAVGLQLLCTESVAQLGQTLQALVLTWRTGYEKEG